MSEEWYRARTGLDRQSLFREFQQTVGVTFDVPRAAASSIERFKDFSHLIKPLDPVQRFAAALQKRAIPIAVATNSEREVAEVSLSTSGSNVIFSQLVCISDVDHPKPLPDLFMAAAERLKVSRHKTLVIEDSPQGVQAAKAAEMSVIQIVEHVGQVA